MFINRKAISKSRKTVLARERLNSLCCMAAGLAGHLPFSPTKMGNWWNAKEEIDLVVLGDTKRSYWTSKPVGSDILAGLERKARLVEPELEGRTIRCGLCSRAAFTDQLRREAEGREDVVLMDLEAMVR